MFKIKDETVIGNDIFKAPEELKIVTINTVGAMGRGIALSAKEGWPDIYRIYRKRYNDGLLYPDEVWDIRIAGEGGINVAMFPTKEEWWKPSIPGMIIHNVFQLKELVEGGGYKSVAVPPLGMINGWLRGEDDLKNIVLSLRTAFRESDVEVTLYCPHTLFLRLKDIFNVA